MRWVIYAEASGTIRAVIIGDQAVAQANVRPGEAMVQHFGYVSAARHEVRDSKVVLKA